VSTASAGFIASPSSVEIVSGVLHEPSARRAVWMTAWPLLTGLALWGYTRYVAGHTRSAGWAFIAYSILGISTIGHFLGPSPDIPAFFFVTIFTDFVTGTAMLAFDISGVRGEIQN